MQRVDAIVLLQQASVSSLALHRVYIKSGLAGAVVPSPAATSLSVDVKHRRILCYREVSTSEVHNLLGILFELWRIVST